jgi:hypothetical protein
MLGGMNRFYCIAAGLSCSSALWAQPAVIEFSGILGECNPIYAAVQDELRLYREPNLESEEIAIPYRAGWRIEAPRHEGLTRVLEIGSLRVTEPDEEMRCSVPPQEGPETLVPGEIVEYLFYRGEGVGEIRFRGAQCSAEVVEDYEHFELIKLPVIQAWFHIFNADGTSPGWLLFDGTQIQVARVEC